MRQYRRPLVQAYETHLTSCKYISSVVSRGARRRWRSNTEVFISPRRQLCNFLPPARSRESCGSTTTCLFAWNDGAHFSKSWRCEYGYGYKTMSQLWSTQPQGVATIPTRSYTGEGKTVTLCLSWVKAVDGRQANHPVQKESYTEAFWKTSGGLGFIANCSWWGLPI